MSFYSQEELELFGFLSLGYDVKISKKASIYGAHLISLGSHVRIDDFCVLSAGCGGIKIEDYVHIAVYSSLIGAGKITLSNFCNISSRVSIYSSNDDYSGKFLTNPTVPVKYTGVTSDEVFFEKHVIVGSGAVILPGVRLEEGVAVGALSLVNENCKAFGIYAGVLAIRIGERKRDLLAFENELEI